MNEHSFIFAILNARSEQNKKIAIQKAMEMIVAHGFDGMSMQKLATTAGVSPATIYIYFKNREDLFNQIFNEVEETFSKVAFGKFQILKCHLKKDFGYNGKTDLNTLQNTLFTSAFMNNLEILHY